MYYPRFTKVIIDYFMTRKPSIPRQNRINWHYVRDDVLFSTIKVVSRHQTTQQYVPKPKASARKKKGGSALSTPPPTPIATPTPTTTVVAALRLSAAAKGVPDVPSDDSEEELSWNSSDDEDVDEQTKGREKSEGDKTDESDDGNDDDNDETVKAGSERDEDDDDNDDEEELAKNDDEDTESGKGGDEVSESEGESDEEETRQEEEESFDPIPRTPEGSDDEGNDEKDQDLRLSEEARIQEEEEADELYRDVDINQGRGLQVTQNIEDSHVILTPVHPDGLQESSSVEGGEHASASTPSETATESAGRSTIGSQSRQLSANESAFAEEHVQTTCQMEEPSHPMFETAAQGDAQSWIRELARGSCNSLTELEYHLEEVYKATTDQLDWVNPEGQQYPHNLLQPLPLIPDNRGRRVIPFEHFINNDLEYLRGVNRESALDVYSKRRIIAVTELKIVEWHNYKHMDWISVRRDDDKIYKFKEGDFKRLRLQDIEDILLLLLPEEAQPYEARQYRSDLKRREAYAAYSNPRGFIYQNKDKKNRLMRINELHRFSNEMLNDVRNALDDRLKGIQMQYLPTKIWRIGDKDRAAAMIQEIDKMLKTRRIMRSLK
nr:hypothetical protein [Tanacetum cinerariifolium]